jgi:hypothetical protein
MITRLTAAIVALLAFAGMILAGLAAGNPFETILYRALIGLLVGLIVGHVAGTIARWIVHEHFSSLIDRDTEAELAAEAAVAAGDVAAAGAEAMADSTRPQTPPGAAQQDAAENPVQDAKFGSRQMERLTRDQTLSMRAAKEMQKQL